jgi:tRNA threonylcarbamoyladenosine biosynthesis protein TsaB
MVVLSLETSQRVGSVALARRGELLGAERFGAASSHLIELGVAIDRLLDRHGLEIDKVERVALVAGPGSFTGLRIGMAFAKGLHAGLGLEIATIGSLELLALPHLETHATVCAMLDAHKREVYAAVYGRDFGPVTGARTLVEPCAVPAVDFMKRVDVATSFFVGSGVQRYHDTVRQAAPGAKYAEPLDQSPSAEHLARIGHRLDALPRERVRTLEPDYIRSSEAELKRLKP